MTDIYFFDLVTGEYKGQGVAEVDQFLNDVVPANATIQVPPSLTANQSLICDIVTGGWNVYNDFRTSDWYLKSDGSKVIFALGDVPNPVTMTEIAKSSVNPELYVWDTANDHVIDYTFNNNVALSGVAPLIQDGNDLTGVTTAVVALTFQDDTAEIGIYDYVEAAGNYTLTLSAPASATWIYDLDATKAYQKRKVSGEANSNVATALDDGVNTILDVVAFAFATIDSLSYKTIVPPVVDATIATNVALSGALPQPNALVDNDKVLLTGQTDPAENGYYDYQETGPNYALTAIVIPDTPFYDGVKYEATSSEYQADQDWSASSLGAANYLGIFAERKRAILADIDAATTGPDILAINWVPF